MQETTNKVQYYDVPKEQLPHGTTFRRVYGSPQRSDVSRQRSAFSYQRSAFSYQRSDVSSQRAAGSGHPFQINVKKWNDKFSKHAQNKALKNYLAGKPWK